MPYGFPATMSPENIARMIYAQTPEAEIVRQQQKELIDDILKFKNIINNTNPGAILTTDEKTLQFITLNRDWESLFTT